MAHTLRKRVNQEINWMENKAELGDFLIPQVVQIIQREDNSLYAERMSLEFGQTEGYPDKLDLITALLSWYETQAAKAGKKVLCSVFGEHLQGPGGELAYFQVKQGQRLKHRVLAIERNHFSVGPDGGLTQQTKLTRYINHDKVK